MKDSMVIYAAKTYSIKVNGTITSQTLKTVKARINDLLMNKSTECIIEICDIHDIDWEGIGYLLKIQEEADSNNIPLRLNNINQSIVSMLHILHLDEKFLKDSIDQKDIL